MDIELPYSRPDLPQILKITFFSDSSDRFTDLIFNSFFLLQFWSPIIALLRRNLFTCSTVNLLIHLTPLVNHWFVVQFHFLFPLFWRLTANISKVELFHCNFLNSIASIPKSDPSCLSNCSIFYRCGVGVMLRNV